MIGELFGLGVVLFTTLSLAARLGLPILPRDVQFYVKLVHLFAATVFVSFWAAVIGAVLQRVAPEQLLDFPLFVGRSYYHTVRLVCGVSVVIEGYNEYLADPLFQAVLVMNHQDSLDVAVMGAITPLHCTVMAKKALKNVPFLGSFMVATRAFFMERGNAEKDRETMRKAVEDMNHHHMSLLVYPEGTRSHKADRTLLPFKKGGFHVAVQAQVPIVPVVFSAYDDIFHTRGRRFHGGTVHVRVLPPIPTAGISPEDKPAINALIAEARDTMLATLWDISPVPAAGVTRPETLHAVDRRSDPLKARASVAGPKLAAQVALAAARSSRSGGASVSSPSPVPNVPSSGGGGVGARPVSPVHSVGEDSLAADQRLDREDAYLNDFATPAAVSVATHTPLPMSPVPANADSVLIQRAAAGKADQEDE